MLGICSYRLAPSFSPNVLILGEQDPCHFRAERPSRHVIGQKARPGPSPALVMGNEVAARTVLVRIHWLSAGLQRKLSQAERVTG